MFASASERLVACLFVARVFGKIWKNGIQKAIEGGIWWFTLILISIVYYIYIYYVYTHIMYIYRYMYNQLCIYIYINIITWYVTILAIKLQGGTQCQTKPYAGIGLFNCSQFCNHGARRRISFGRYRNNVAHTRIWLVAAIWWKKSITTKTIPKHTKTIFLSAKQNGK